MAKTNTAKPAFTFDVQTIEKPARAAARTIDEAYRPIFDAVSTLDEGQALAVTLDSEKSADAAKSTVQALANDAGFTARERRGSRVTHEDGTVTLSLTKRPRQTRKPTETDAAAE